MHNSLASGVGTSHRAEGRLRDFAGLTAYIAASQLWDRAPPHKIPPLHVLQAQHNSSRIEARRRLWNGVRQALQFAMSTAVVKAW